MPPLTLLDLPVGLILHIASMLEINDRGALAMACSLLAKTARDESAVFWEIDTLFCGTFYLNLECREYEEDKQPARLRMSHLVEALSRVAMPWKRLAVEFGGSTCIELDVTCFLGFIGCHLKQLEGLFVSASVWPQYAMWLEAFKKLRVLELRIRRHGVDNTSHHIEVATSLRELEVQGAGSDAPCVAGHLPSSVTKVSLCDVKVSLLPFLPENVHETLCLIGVEPDTLAHAPVPLTALTALTALDLENSDALVLPGSDFMPSSLCSMCFSFEDFQPSRVFERQDLNFDYKSRLPLLRDLQLYNIVCPGTVNYYELFGNLTSLTLNVDDLPFNLALLPNLLGLWILCCSQFDEPTVSLSPLPPSLHTLGLSDGALCVPDQLDLSSTRLTSLDLSCMTVKVPKCLAQRLKSLLSPASKDAIIVEV